MPWLLASPGGRFNIKMLSYQYMILMLKIRWSQDRLIFNMGIPYLERQSLYWDGAQVITRKDMGAVSIYRCRLTSIGIPVLKMVFIMRWGHGLCQMGISLSSLRVNHNNVQYFIAEKRYQKQVHISTFSKQLGTSRVSCLRVCNTLLPYVVTYLQAHA